MVFLLHKDRWIFGKLAKFRVRAPLSMKEEKKSRHV